MTENKPQYSSYQRAWKQLVHRREHLAGILIFAMIALTIAHGFSALGHNLLLAGGLAGWGAALLLLPSARRMLKIQVWILLFLGFLLLLYTVIAGGEVAFTTTVTANTPLLTMIAAVGFLRLVAIPQTETATGLPSGRKSFLTTLLGLNLFSSVINVSAPIIICDRIHAERRLDRLTASAVIRVFCGVSSWSPFYGAMAVVLTYLPHASLGHIILAGLPFSLAGLLLVYLSACVYRPTQVADFIGYPMKRSMLQVPLMLVLTVTGGFLLFPHQSALLIIATSALLVTMLLLGLRHGLRRMFIQSATFICSGLPAIVNELVLFLSAGVLATGITGLVQLGFITTPFDQFTTVTALQVLGIIILLSVIGIHPVISISSLTALLLPLNPSPDLLAITYLFGWHLGTCSSPLSGTNLMFQGRYQIPAWKSAFWNWPYTASMFLLAIPWLLFIF